MIFGAKFNQSTWLTPPTFLFFFTILKYFPFLFSLHFLGQKVAKDIYRYYNVLPVLLVHFHFNSYSAIFTFPQHPLTLAHVRSNGSIGWSSSSSSSYFGTGPPTSNVYAFTTAGRRSTSGPLFFFFCFQTPIQSFLCTALSFRPTDHSYTLLQMIRRWNEKLSVIVVSQPPPAFKSVDFLCLLFNFELELFTSGRIFKVTFWILLHEIGRLRLSLLLCVCQSPFFFFLSSIGYLTCRPHSQCTICFFCLWPYSFFYCFWLFSKKPEQPQCSRFGWPGNPTDQTAIVTLWCRTKCY